MPVTVCKIYYIVQCFFFFGLERNFTDVEEIKKRENKEKFDIKLREHLVHT